MDLTLKQEKFALLVANGSTQADAYREVYDIKKMSDKTLYDTASKLANSPGVSQRIKELKDKIEEKVINGFAKTKDDILIKLESLIKRAEEPAIYCDKDGSPIIKTQ